jgi:two-component system nitrate/nitrite response regulator NarL
MGAHQPVAVVGRLPALRRGFASLLADTEFAPEEPGDLIAWAGEPDHKVLLMVVSELEDMRLVVDLTSIRDDVAVVALVPEVTPQIVREAVIAGVTSVSTWDASPEEVDSLLHAALESRSMVPTSVLEKLVKSSRVSTEPVDISSEETEWLQALANGETVSQLAERIAYSEREVYRLLRARDETLGVRSRVEALVWAAQHGVVHE